MPITQTRRRFLSIVGLTGAASVLPFRQAKAAELGALTSVREKLIKIGAKIVSHSC